MLIQRMVKCWFGFGMPLWKGLLLRGTPSRIPNHQLTIGWQIWNQRCYIKSKQQKHHSCIVPSDHRAIAEIRGICSLCYHHHPPSILSRYSYTTIDDAPTSFEMQVIFVKISILPNEITWNPPGKTSFERKVCKHPIRSVMPLLNPTGYGWTFNHLQ